MNSRFKRGGLAALGLFLLCGPTCAMAQAAQVAAPTSPLTLEQAIEFARTYGNAP